MVIRGLGSGRRRNVVMLMILRSVVTTPGTNPAYQAINNTVGIKSIKGDNPGEIYKSEATRIAVRRFIPIYKQLIIKEDGGVNRKTFLITHADYRGFEV